MEKILEEINKSAIKLLVPLTTEETYKIIVEEAKKIIGGDYGSILLAENGTLQRVYTNAEFLREVKPRKAGNAFQTFITNELHVLNSDTIEKYSPVYKKYGIKSLVHIPLSYEDKSIGVLTIKSCTQRDYSDGKLHIFKLFGALASMAIRKMQLYEETKNALETRDLFISLASHELRTPLTSINGYIQLLYRKLSSENTVEAKWVNELYHESARLTNLVKELLEINRIKQGQLHFELQECSVEDFVDAAIDRYTFINKDRKVIFTKDIPPEKTVIGDPNKLLQMISALLNNADKFSPKGTPVEVSVTVTKNQVIIKVKDQGKGMTKEDITKVFDGFYKGDYEHAEGLGVGLLLAKHIVKYHHGSIDIKSKKDKGTSVEVRLPTTRFE